MESVVESINVLVEKIKGASVTRKTEICVILAADSAPYYDEYVHRKGNSETFNQLIRKIIDAWSKWSSNSTESIDISGIEEIILDIDSDVMSVYAQNAAICALHMARYMSEISDNDLEECITSYFDNIDYMTQEDLIKDKSIPPSEIDAAVVGSELFKQKIDMVLHLLAQSETTRSTTVDYIKNVYENERAKLSGR